MNETKVTSSTDERLAVFRDCFAGLTNVYGTYDPTTGRVRQVKRPVTDRVLLDHIRGIEPYGVYLLVEDRTRALAFDFDEADLAGPRACLAALGHYGISAYLERSKSKGFHAWVFFTEPVLAGKARRVAWQILKETNQPQVEIFPKQDRLDSRATFGNFIFAPLFGQSAAQGRTVFVDPDDLTKPYADQWSLLEKVHRVSEAALDQVLRTCGISAVASVPPRSSTPPPATSEARFFLPPCARKILSCGVGQFQREVCFRLAVHCYRLGLPLDIAIAVLKAWAAKNKPRDGKTIISDQEIADQVNCAYRKGYRGFGCQTPGIAAFCDPSCRFKRDDAVPAQGGPHA